MSDTPKRGVMHLSIEAKDPAESRVALAAGTESEGRFMFDNPVKVGPGDVLRVWAYDTAPPKGGMMFTNERLVKGVAVAVPLGPVVTGEAEALEDPGPVYSEPVEPYYVHIAAALAAKSLEEKRDLYAQAARNCTEGPLKGVLEELVAALEISLDHADLQTCFKQLRSATCITVDTCPAGFRTLANRLRALEAKGL